MSRRVPEHIRIKQFEECGYTFIKWANEYKNNTSKAHLQCSKGHSVIKAINNRTSNCAECTRLSKMKSITEYIEIIQGKGYNIIDTNCAYDRSSSIVVSCDSGHVKTSKIETLVDKNFHCGVCASNNRIISKDTRIEQINQTSFEFIEWDTEFTGVFSKAKVKCRNNHITIRSVDNIIRRVGGCRLCVDNTGKDCGGKYHTKNFDRDPELANTIGTFYVLKCTNKEESSTEVFFKFGITKSDSARVSNLLKKNYNVCIILEQSMSLYEAYKKEQSIKTKFSYAQYVPHYEFDGKTECLDYSFDIKELLQNDS